MAHTSALSEFASRLRVRIQTAAQWDELCTDRAFNALALELFRLQKESNPIYRRFVQAKGLEMVEHWSQIPAAPTSGFKEYEFSCLPAGERVRTFHSSGTTGQRPSCHYHNEASLALYEDSAWAWFAANLLPGISSGHVGSIVILTPPPSQSPHSSLVHMFEVVRQRMQGGVSAYTAKVAEDGSWDLELQVTREALEAAASAGLPTLVLGTAFSFVHLLDYLLAQKLTFRLPSGSRVMETGGYKGRSRSVSKAELHKLIGKQFGIGPGCLFSEYGMSELSSQAYDGDRRNDGRPLVVHSSLHLLRFPPWARAQIVSPETEQESGLGKMGLIRVFDLANTFSVMAIQTEDLGIRYADGFQLIGRAAMAEGRGCSLMPTS